MTGPLTAASEDPLLHNPLPSAPKALLASYYVLILLICWSGNIFTLYATIKHHAIKLDKLSVWIIQNLCVADVLHGWIHVLPVVIALISNYDLEPVCKPLLVVKYVFIDTNSFLINALVFNKLYRCKYPFRPSPPAKARYMLSLCAGLSGCLYASVTIIKVMNTDTARFYENYFGCEADEQLPAQYETLDLVMTCVVLVVPVTTLLIANTVLLITALSKGMNLPEYHGKNLTGTERRKSLMGAQINKRSFLIVGVTTIVYTIAQLPYLYFCFEMYGIIDTLHGLTFVNFTRFTFVIMQSSCFVNPFIYFLTNEGFRLYTTQCVYVCLNKLTPEKRRMTGEARLSTLSSGKNGSIIDRMDSHGSVFCNVRAYSCDGMTVPRHKSMCATLGRADDDRYSLRLPPFNPVLTPLTSNTSITHRDHDPLSDTVYSPANGKTSVTTNKQTLENEK